jgi:predicted Fe-Mo cluster-binding NifX family protein
MRILIGTNNESLTSKIAKRFGHAEYYLIYDNKNKDIEIISNPEHDEKHQVLLDAINNNIKNFIVGNIGPHAFSILHQDGVNIFLARNITAEEALKKLEKNELELLLEPTVRKSMHKH